MYTFMEKVNQLIDKHAETLNNPQFYRYRIRTFFEEYMSDEQLKDCPLDEIASHHIKKFLGLEKIKNDATNYYFALKSFFEFTFILKETGDVMKGVPVPRKESKELKYLSGTEIKKVKAFLKNYENDIEERLLLGFFFYTGLSRKYIAKLEFGCIELHKDMNLLQVDQRSNSIPLADELVSLIEQYKDSVGFVKPKNKLFDYDENYLSTKVVDILKKVLARKVTPTELSNTFIRECFKKSKDVYLISRLVLESPATIIKHLEQDEENELRIFKEQKKIVQCLYQ